MTSLGKHWELGQITKNRIRNALKGKILTEEHKKRISITMKDKKLSLSKDAKEKLRQRMLGNQIRKGLRHTEESKQKIRDSMTIEEYRQAGIKGVKKQQDMKEPTSIEKTLYDYLLMKGVLFERQKLINGRFLVDAYIPSLNLIIEADGNYWHGLDRIIKKDKAENAYLKKCGFNVIRLTEEEIKSDKFTERMVL